MIEMKLSAFVKARLLFKREIEIDGVTLNLLDDQYLERLIAQKNGISSSLEKQLQGSFLLTLALYLAGVGTSLTVPVFEIGLSNFPGALTFLTFASAISVSVSITTFLNQQAYDALIDQVILQKSETARIDPDILKAAHSSEWLLMKIFRKDFNFYHPVHIEMSTFGRALNNATFVALFVITVSPLIILAICQPALAIVFLQDDIISNCAKVFSVATSLTGVGAIVVSNTRFQCKVDVGASKEKSD